jgi:hypothetical protein
MELKLQDLAESKDLEKATQLFNGLIDKSKDRVTYEVSFEEYKAISSHIFNSDPGVQIAFILKTVDETALLRDYLGEPSKNKEAYESLRHQKEHPWHATNIVHLLFRRKFYFTEKQLLFLANRIASLEIISLWSIPYLDSIVRNVEKAFKDRIVPPSIDRALEQLEQALAWNDESAEIKLRQRIQRFRSGPVQFPLNPINAWAHDIQEYVEHEPKADRASWLTLLAWTFELKQMMPTEKWITTARKHLEAIGKGTFVSRVIEWLPRVSILTHLGLENDKVEELKATIESIDEDGFAETFFSIQCKMDKRGEDTSFFDLVRAYYGAPDSPWMLKGRYKQTVLDLIPSIRKHPVRFEDCNNDALKGLVWYCSLAPGPEISRALGRLCEVCFKKLPGVGPLAPKAGNACINVLAETGTEDSLAQLGRLRYTIRLKSAQKIIGKAFDKAAGRMGVGRDELEEMSVPGYGLTEVGVGRETMGDFTAELTADSSGTELRWIRAGGKASTAVPAAVKRDFAEEVKELKAAAKDIARMLPAQRQRVECLYLQNRSWSYPIWRQRYLDHPLVGIIARKLIWALEDDGKTREAMFFDGKLVDVDGEAIEGASDKTIVRLWHPIGHDPDAIFAWRTFLENRQIRQPFKQAHREIYVLTPAERQTLVYSNRFAAHIVKQHQFNALCGVRGWSNALKLMVDQDFPPPSIVLPAWGLRAEFWTDGLGEEYGVDTNETGTFKYLATDQVRFLRMDARQARGHASSRGQVATDDPVPLTEIPPLVLSEVMRDIDLFVGVASVGNDPGWADSGPEGHRDYWQHYAFGELGQQAQTRREVLMNLIPRMKIAERCRFEERFLVVRGDLRTYKIHLGSGNILMEPDDQYLCIVRHSSKEVESGAGKVFLPFEGDLTLATIISKAILLAADARITDETILSQIRR